MEVETVTHVICNKEKEIATMTEKINNIEKTVDNIDRKLNLFIDKADGKYATKEEVNLLKKETASNTKKIVDLTVKWATLAGMAYIILKQSGVQIP